MIFFFLVVAQKSVQWWEDRHNSNCQKIWLGLDEAFDKKHGLNDALCDEMEKIKAQIIWVKEGNCTRHQLLWGMLSNLLYKAHQIP